MDELLKNIKESEFGRIVLNAIHESVMDLYTRLIALKDECDNCYEEIIDVDGLWSKTSSLLHDIKPCETRLDYYEKMINGMEKAVNERE